MVKATISSDYRWRLGLVGALVLFFSLWFFYDAAVTYPAMQEAAAKYRELIRDATPPREDAWKAYARRQTVTINYGQELPLAQGVTFEV